MPVGARLTTLGKERCMQVPELVLMHAQEYMFFDLVIQLVNALLLSYIAITLLRIRRRTEQPKS